MKTTPTKSPRSGLLARFTVIFAVFSLITLIISGFTTYINQTRIYKEQQQERADMMGNYLVTLLQADGNEFLYYQDYFMAHYEEMDVPADFETIDDAWEAYETAMLKYHPGKRLDVNISFDELNPEVQMAYAVYNHEYYLLEFEKAREKFGLAYTYYIVPPSEDRKMTYVLDAVRETRTDGSHTINLGITVDEPIKEHEKMWEAWDTGEVPQGYDMYDNELGRTYAYYMPLYVNGVKLGVIATEVTIASYNRGIFINTIKQLIGLAFALFICVSGLLWFINHFYIAKIKDLADNVREFARTKEPMIAVKVERISRSQHEISELSKQTANMILELDNYIKSLTETKQELSETKEKAMVMQNMAIKDALTGIRNKAGYDKEVVKLEKDMLDGFDEFGLAMIDLNFLKHINDTYGHEKGNISICRLSALICETFEHSPVFRIGGDEFVVVLKGRDYRNIDRLIKAFNLRLKSWQSDDTLYEWEQVSAAVGYAKFDKNIDDSIKNVFDRADKDMYIHKVAMRAQRN